MEDESRESTDSTLDVWEKLLSDQTTLFRKTAKDNTALRARVLELERELSVWKSAIKGLDDDKAILQKTVSKLERHIGSLRDDNPLLLCVIDGDGNIFSQDLIILGQPGGRQAAMLLTKGLTDYVSGADVELSPRGQVWLTVYCNKSGLLEALENNNVCRPEQFEAFITGFNQASPLFSIVDVGHGKEAADSKVKECLRVFTRFPQTLRVFFGGAHDNGYTSTLTSLENEGLSEKIVLLRGYKALAVELRNLNLPQLDIKGVFMTQKLLPAYKVTSAPTVTPTPVQPEDFQKFRTSPMAAASSSIPTDKLRYPDPSQPLNKQKPPPCNFYYLSACNQGLGCTNGHDYILSPENFVELRRNAKRSPCPIVNNNQICPHGDSCCSGHYCPRAKKCIAHTRGKCKFVGRDMHKERPHAGRDSRMQGTCNSEGGSFTVPATPVNQSGNLSFPSIYPNTFVPPVLDGRFTYGRGF